MEGEVGDENKSGIADRLELPNKGEAKESLIELDEKTPNGAVHEEEEHRKDTPEDANEAEVVDAIEEEEDEESAE